MTRTSYLEFFAEKISPRLKAIDLALKEEDGISPAYAAELLELSPWEISEYISESGILTRSAFLRLMSSGSSEICRLFKRELERKSPVLYSAEDISYIYGINPELVEAAFAKIHGTSVTAYMLPAVFSEIPL